MKKITVVIDLCNGRIWKGIVADDLDIEVRLIVFNIDHNIIWDRPVRTDSDFVHNAEELATSGKELGMFAEAEKALSQTSRGVDLLCKKCRKKYLQLLKKKEKEERRKQEAKRKEEAEKEHE